MGGCGSSGGGGQTQGPNDSVNPPASIPTWAKSFGGPGEEQANAAIATDDGGVVFTGVRRDPVTGNRDVWVARLDAFGDPIWQRVIGEMPTNDIYVTTIARANDDTFWVAGTTAGDTRLFVSRYAGDGTPLATSTFDLAPHPVYESTGAAPEFLRTFIDLSPTRAGGILLVVPVEERVLAPLAGSSVVQHRSSVSLQVLAFDGQGNAVWSSRLTQREFESVPLPTVLIREATPGNAVVAAELSSRAIWVASVNAGGTVNWARDFEYLERIELIDIAVVDGDLDAVPGDELIAAVASSGTELLRIDRSGNERWRETLEDRPNAVVERCTGPGGEYRCALYLLGSRSDTDAGIVDEPFLIRLEHDTGGAEQIARIAYPGLELRSSAPLLSLPDSPAGTALLFGGVRRAETGPAIVTVGVRADLAEVSRQVHVLSSPWRGSITPLPDGGTVLLDFDDRSIRRTQPTGELAWTQSLRSGTTAMESGQTIVAAGDGGFVVGAGRHADLSGKRSVPWLLKFTADGDLEWQRTFDEVGWPRPDLDRPVNALAALPDGGFMLLGEVDGQVYLFRLDSGGVPLGTTQPLSAIPPNSEFLWNAEVAVDEAGAVALIGVAQAQSIVSIDNAGSLLWRRGSLGASGWSGLTLLGSGDIVLGGFYARADGAVPAAARFRRDDAEVVWHYSYPAQRLLGDYGQQSVTIDARSDDGVWIGTTTPQPPRSNGDPGSDDRATDYVLLRVDAAGRALEYQVLGGLHDEVLSSTDVLSDDGLLVAGRSDSMGDLSEAWVLRLDGDARIAAGCNAALERGLAMSDEAAISPMPLSWAAPPAALPVMSDTSAAPRALVDTVVARQCSGVARSEPVPPQEAFTLQVAQGGASQGVVTSTPAGIVCGTAGGGTCAAQFTAGTTVFLDVDFGSLQRFSRWQGCDDVDGTLCSVQMSADREVTVFFESPDEALLSLAIDVTGSGVVRTADDRLVCIEGDAANCSAQYANGTTAALLAIPDAGQRFLGWGGACAAFGTATEGELLMDSHKHCTASFGDGRFTLTFTDISGPGFVTVRYGDDFQESLTCLASCSRQFEPDERVYVTWSSTGPGVELSGWGGDCSEFGDDSQFFLTMNRSYSCSAAFE